MLVPITILILRSLLVLIAIRTAAVLVPMFVLAGAFVTFGALFAGAASPSGAGTFGMAVAYAILQGGPVHRFGGVLLDGKWQKVKVVRNFEWLFFFR